MATTTEKESALHHIEEDLSRKRLDALRMFMIPSCENIEYALDKVLGVLNDKEYQESLRRTVELSYTTTYETMQRLLTLGRKVACWDEKKLDCLIKDSIPGFMRVGQDFTLRSSEMYKEFASKILDILERTARSCEEKGMKEKGAPVTAVARRQPRAARRRR